MTLAEAQCFSTAKTWQRRYLRRRLVEVLVPRAPAIIEALPALLRWLCYALLAPLLIALWLIKIVLALIFFPFQLLFSYIKPRALRPPGERNIQGIHYSFSRFCDLPPDYYLKCIDDWTKILYGEDKLPQFSIKQYMDADHLLRPEILNSRDAGVIEHLYQQINHAREELSRELGHYK